MRGFAPSLLVVLVFSITMEAAASPRLRDWGIKLGHHKPGKWNAITDVPGVKVGHTTLFRGKGKLVPGKGPVRTGVTVILPSTTKNIWKEKEAS